ncbi:hypothetical protein D3C81_1710490 [compost metagenome]
MAADVSEIAANMAITVIGLVILFFIFSMLVLLCLICLVGDKFVWLSSLADGFQILVFIAKVLC